MENERVAYSSPRGEGKGRRRRRRRRRRRTRRTRRTRSRTRGTPPLLLPNNNRSGRVWCSSSRYCCHRSHCFFVTALRVARVTWRCVRSNRKREKARSRRGKKNRFFSFSNSFASSSSSSLLRTRTLLPLLLKENITYDRHTHASHPSYVFKV